MAEILNIIIDIDADTRTVRVVKEGIKEVGDAAKKSGEQTKGMKESLDQLKNIAGGVAAGMLFLKKTFDFAAEGETINTTAATFATLAENAGTAADVLMNDLRSATRGMTSDLELMQGANRFLIMGLAQTGDQATELTKIAVTLGTALGGSASESIENFALLLANQSLPRLDSFGISSGRVRERVNQLTTGINAMSREMAFTQAVMEEAATTMGDLGLAAGPAVDSYAQLSTTMKNLTDDFKVFLADGLNPAISSFAALANAAADNHGIKAATDSFSAFVEALNQQDDMITQLATSMTDFNRFMEIATDNYGLTADAARRLWMEHNESTMVVQEYTQAMSAANIAIGEQIVFVDELDREYGRFESRLEPLTNDIEEQTRAMQRQAAVMEGQLIDSMASTDELTSTFARTQLNAADATTSHEAALLRQADALALNQQAMAEQQAAIDATVARQRDYNAALSEDFGGALDEISQKGMWMFEHQQDWTQSLLDSSNAAGITSTQMVLLAQATGNYTDAQIEAALETAAMNAKVEELALQLSAGTITVSEALDEMNNFQTSLENTNQSAIATSGGLGFMADESERTAQALRDIPETVHVNVTASFPPVPSYFQDLQAGAAGQGGGEAEFQSGGSIRRGQAALVGEAGPELFIPQSSGTIVPHSSLRQETNNFNMTINTSSMTVPQSVSIARAMVGV